jgi:hypothetical protein
MELSLERQLNAAFLGGNGRGAETETETAEPQPSLARARPRQSCVALETKKTIRNCKLNCKTLAKYGHERLEGKKEAKHAMTD